MATTGWMAATGWLVDMLVGWLAVTVGEKWLENDLVDQRLMMVNG